MSIYTNQINVGMAEMARLHCLESFNGNSKVVAELVMPYEVLKNLHMVIGQVITQHDENIAKQREVNKKLS